MPRILLLSLASLAIGGILCPESSAWAQSAPRETFEGPDPSWQPAGANVDYVIRGHQRLQRDAHGGHGCELIHLDAAAGTYVLFSHEIGRSSVIPELRINVWLKSNRPGLQLSARVVLPRTLDPQTGRPVTALLRGSSYARVGSWERLTVEDVPRLLAREVRVLHTRLGPHVDSREAYLDLAMLNVYGGPGETTAWIDDLELTGSVSPSQFGGEAARSNAHASVRLTSFGSSQEPVSTGGPRVRLQGPLLLVDGHPLLVRAIEHRGEPLEYLARLGFNAVKLASPPLPSILEEAERAGLWLIAPPPDVRSGRSIGPMYRRVLTWDLGSGLSAPELTATRELSSQVRGADEADGRPLVCGAETELRTYSRYADILLLERPTLSTCNELAELAPWLLERPRLARPGVAVWSAVATQPGQEVQAQMRALTSVLGSNSTVSVGNPPVAMVESEQLRVLAFTALAAGSGGLVFHSDQRVDADNSATKLRAATLALVNAELALIEPWAASSSVVTTVTSSDPQVRVYALETERSKLLIALSQASGGQYVSAPPGSEAVSLVVPGVSESSQAFQLTPVGLKPLRHKRVTGGIRVTIEEYGMVSLIVLTQDPLVLTSMSRRLGALGTRAAQLRRDVVAGALAETEAIHARLIPETEALPQADAALGQARTALAECDRLLAAGDASAALVLGERSMKSVSQLRRSYWDRAVRDFSAPAASALCTSFASLPWHWQLAGQLRGTELGPNLLPAGTMENLEHLVQSGWQHFQHAHPGIQTMVELSPREPRSGGFSLHIAAIPADQEVAASVVESPPIWVTSPAIPVSAGIVYRIHGWIRVPRAIAGSPDGLLVMDSLGGRALAYRAQDADVWREFTLYRGGVQQGSLSLTVALTGLGEVFVDDLTISALTSAAAVPPAPNAASPGAPSMPAVRPNLPSRGTPFSAPPIVNPPR